MNTFLLNLFLVMFLISIETQLGKQESAKAERKVILYYFL